MVTDMIQRGWTTIQIKVAKPTPNNPKGGTYERLEKKQLVKGETWDSVISRLLDFHDRYQDDGK